MLITNFNARYGRKGTIRCSTEICDKCLKKEIVIEIDPSEDEYISGKICQNCINVAFEKYHNEKDYSKPIQCPVVRQFDHVVESEVRKDSDINIIEQ